MRAYAAYIKITTKLVMRDRVVLFFNYFLPLLFFIVFAQTFHGERGGALSQVITMVLILGVLGSGFFGAGLRAVQERELNILRRFKVAPITPLPILAASLVTGWLTYLPSVFMILGLAHLLYGMPWPERWLSLLALLSIGLISFRSIGLIVASIANSMQESQIIIQLLYLPMLFLSGATFPVSLLPDWLQRIAQFLPATYLYTGLQGILVQGESLAANSAAAGAMVLMLVVALFLAVKLFRWEKGEKVRGSAKLYLLAALLPFVALGAYQSFSMENVAKAKILHRQMRRNQVVLIRGPRILTGEGKIIENGAVLLRRGRIARIWDEAPAEKEVEAEVVEAAGKTLIAGLVDALVHLPAQGGVLEKPIPDEKAVARALAAHLYCGVIAVGGTGDPTAVLLRAQEQIRRGERLGAELVPLAKSFAGSAVAATGRQELGAHLAVDRETAYLPATAAEAEQQLEELRSRGVARVRVVFGSGSAARPAARLDSAILRAVVERARPYGIPVAAQTANARDIADAVAAGVAIIEHGSAVDVIPDALLAQMAKRKIMFIPALAEVEAIEKARAGLSDPLERSLAQQVAPEGLIPATRKALAEARLREFAADSDARLEVAMDNLRRAAHAGVPLAAGSGAGNLLVIHGPGVHRELQLWVRAGLEPAVALQAATKNGAALLGIGQRAGFVGPGADASFILLDGNPLADISATERISAVYFRGERVERSELFDQR